MTMTEKWSLSRCWALKVELSGQDCEKQTLRKQINSTGLGPLAQKLQVGFRKISPIHTFLQPHRIFLLVHSVAN